MSPAETTTHELGARDPGRRPLDLPGAIQLCGSPDGCESLCDKCQVRMLAVCAALDEDELKELEAIAEHCTVAGRHTLFQEGDAARHVYSITSGTLRLQRDIDDGRRQVVGFALPGDFLGLSLESSFGFGADALTPVTACRFERNRFTELVSRKPELQRKLHQTASRKLAFAEDHMVVLGRRKAEERVAIFLLRWSERLQVLRGPSPTLPLPMGRQDIADYLGLTIETVSRTISRFTRDRIILVVPDGVRVLDRSKLIQAANATHA